MNRWFFVMIMGVSLLCLGVVQAAGASAMPRVYKINHVAPDDTLNLRSVPGIAGEVLTTIPHNGKGILSTGNTQQLGRTTWAEVHWSGQIGWVNHYYLLEDVHTTNYNPGQQKREKSDVFMQCNGTEPFWSIKITETQMDIHVLDGPKYRVPVDFRQQSANNTSIAVVAGRRGNALTSAFLQKVEACSDGMSDRNYPYSVAAIINSHRVVSGCCGITGVQ